MAKAPGTRPGPHILVVSGPNLNLLGRREPSLYGRQTLAALMADLTARAAATGAELAHVQSNDEGTLVDALQGAAATADAVILNAGGYTHTSVAIRDAVAAIPVPVVEVHLTNPAAREAFRQVSLLAGVCAGSIAGFGALSYRLALEAALAIVAARPARRRRRRPKAR